MEDINDLFSERAQERFLKVVDILPLYRFGSLFFFDEGEWKARFKQLGFRYDFGNRRKEHPACSITERVNPDFSFPVSFLHGTTRKNFRSVSGLVIDDLDDTGDEHPRQTHFGKIPPVPFVVSELYRMRNTVPKKIRVAQRVALNDNEKKELRTLCLRKKWRM